MYRGLSAIPQNPSDTNPAAVRHPRTEDEESGLLDIEEAPGKIYYTDEEIRQVFTNLCGGSTLSDELWYKYCDEYEFAPCPEY